MATLDSQDGSTTQAASAAAGVAAAATSDVGVDAAAAA